MYVCERTFLYSHGTQEGSNMFTHVLVWGRLFATL